MIISSDDHRNPRRFDPAVAHENSQDYVDLKNIGEELNKFIKTSPSPELYEILRKITLKSYEFAFRSGPDYYKTKI